MNTTELIANKPASERPRKGEHMETRPSMDERAWTDITKDGIKYVPVRMLITAVTYLPEDEVNLPARAGNYLNAYAWNGGYAAPSKAAQQLAKDLVNSAEITRMTATPYPVMDNYLAFNSAPQNAVCNRNAYEGYVQSNAIRHGEPMPAKHVDALDAAILETEEHQRAMKVAQLKAYAKQLGISLSELAGC